MKENKENKCVYVFLDHRKPGKYVYDDLEFDYEPIYVGKGNYSRPSGHKYSLNKKKTRFYYKYNKILEETNKPPEFKIIKNKLKEEDANKLESELIKRIGKIDNGGTLTNLTDGGDHNGGFKLDKSIINKRTETIKNSVEYNISRLNKFIEKSKKIHGDKYDYSLVEYKNAKTNVKIICPEHGVFEQLPTAHINKRGCQKCGNNYRKTTEEFIEKANQVHNHKYDYSLCIYKGALLKVKIICPVHGVFEQTAESHIGKRKYGCPYCSKRKKPD